MKIENNIHNIFALWLLFIVTQVHADEVSLLDSIRWAFDICKNPEPDLEHEEGYEKELFPHLYQSQLRGTQLPMDEVLAPKGLGKYNNSILVRLPSQLAPQQPQTCISPMQERRAPTSPYKSPFTYTNGYANSKNLRFNKFDNNNLTSANLSRSSNYDPEGWWNDFLDSEDRGRPKTFKKFR